MARIEDLEDVGYRVKYDDEGNVVGIVGNRGEPSPFVLATTNKLTGGIEIDGLQTGGDTRPVVCIGGDHPYDQIWGTDGSNGLAALYKSFGITPYLALNTRSLTFESVGSPYSMGWDKVKSLSDAGMIEPVSHGARHYQDWEAPDAGIHVRYTGAAATATMYITSTAVIGATAGAVEDFNFSFATYPAIDQLVSAIAALPNWSCTRSPELIGTELSKNLLTIAPGSAKDCKSGLPDFYGRRFSMVGGLRVFWDSSITNVDSVSLYLQTTATAIAVYRDGVHIGTFALASHTLGSLLTAIKALNAAFGAKTTLISDNGQQPYCTGEEDATNLVRGLSTGIVYDIKRSPGLLIGGGLTPSYLRACNMRACKDDCAANGVNVRTFAQSGGSFWSHLPATAPVGIYEHFRGDPQWDTTAPCAMPTSSAVGFHTHINLGGNYDDDAYIDTLVDSIIASKGFAVDMLIHHVATDAIPDDGSAAGSSGYYLDSAHLGGDIAEGPFVHLLARLKAARDAGLIRIVKHSEMNAVASTALPPQNMLYNPTLRSRPTIPLATESTGKAVPGWRLETFGLPAAVAVDGGIKFQMLTGAKDVLVQRVMLKRGERYKAGFRMESDSGQVTMAAIRIGAVYGDWPDTMVASQLRYIQSATFTRPNDDVEFDFEIPWSKANGNPRIVSINAQPYNLSVNKNIQISMEGISMFDIDCSVGAVSSGAVTAKEVAAAINAAISANALYAGRPELHSIARGENNRVVLEMPRRQGWPSSPGNLQLSNGSTLNAATLIFSSSYGNAWSNHGGEDDATRYPVEFRVTINAPTGTNVSVIEPYLIPFAGGR